MKESMMVLPRPHVAIVGGENGGLFPANALIAQGIPGSVYQQAPQIGEVRGSVVLPPHLLPHLLPFRLAYGWLEDASGSEGWGRMSAFGTVRPIAGKSASARENTFWPFPCVPGS